MTESSPLLEDEDAGASTAASLPNALFRRLAWRVLPLLWCGYAMNIVDRVNLGYASLQMAPELHLSPQAYGYASGVFFLSYALMQVPTNHVISTSHQGLGATRMLSLSMILWGIASASTSLVRTERQLCALRFCLGLAESGYYPGVLVSRAATEHAPLRSRLAPARVSRPNPVSHARGLMLLLLRRRRRLRAVTVPIRSSS